MVSMSKILMIAAIAAATAGAPLNGFCQAGSSQPGNSQTVNSQAPAPAAGPQEPAAPAPQGPAPQGAAPADPFPPVNLKNFTADSPSREEVNSFLHAIWGFDDSRIWSVAAVLKTPAPGVTKVVVFMANKSNPGKLQQAVFFVTPDGQHAIAGDVIDFGAKPFAATRKLLEDHADGPAEGAASKNLMLVEFADLQCPHCKAAQETMANLARDFPQARIVFENLPIPTAHPYAIRAAEEGVCVRKAKGDAAFFKYAQAVFDKQDQLTPAGVEATLGSAATAAGADPKAMAACASTPAAQDDVKASMSLAADLGIGETPVLAVNGHMIPLNAMRYDTLKRIIAFQAGQDGITVQVQPSLTTLQ